MRRTCRGAPFRSVPPLQGELRMSRQPLSKRRRSLSLRSQSHKCGDQPLREAGIDLLFSPPCFRELSRSSTWVHLLNLTTKGFLEALKDEPVLGQPSDRENPAHLCRGPEDDDPPTL